jgi:ubiquinone/menaquinone biosynthesis C-methylase UbiE
MIEPSDILDWQQSYVENVSELLRWNYLAKRPNIRVLDAGCDPTGKQLWHLAGLVRGSVTGINIAGRFPSPEAVALLRSRPNARLLRMDALRTDFPDESFDLVISANIIEHIADSCQFIRECHRVLKPTGLAYFETYPIWTSARGHHVMRCLVHQYGAADADFRDDGSILPDWPHLRYSEAQVRELLAGKLSQKAVDYIVNLIYHSEELNRTGWRRINAAFEQMFPVRKLATSPVADADVTEDRLTG